MLEVSELNVAYGESHVIRDVSLRVAPDEAVAIMGRNGMGKTTLLKSLIGLLPARAGSIRLGGADITKLPSYQRVAHGLAFVPQGRMVFPFLTVEQNILSGAAKSGHRTVPDYLYKFFPVLKDMKQRRAGNLSGGQQQMLAIARALISEPKLLILDEPTEGIQPNVVTEIEQVIIGLSERGDLSVLLVEQHVGFALRMTDKYYVLESGRVTSSGAGGAGSEGAVRAAMAV
jgi:urea transport system ATP-binding protein